MKRNLVYILYLAGIFSACILYEPPIDSTPQVPTAIVQETATVSASDTVVPTATQTATLTATATLKPTITLTPTITATTTPLPYHLQSVNPVYLQNFVHPEAGCDWMGVGGQVFDKQGNPTPNLVVWVMGMVDGQVIEQVVLTGTTAGDSYGKAGYEAVLSTKPLNTENVFSIQILNLDGDVLSERVFFPTSAQCDENLIIINFVEE